MEIKHFSLPVCFYFLVANAFSHSVLVMRHGQGMNNIEKVRNSDFTRSQEFPLTELGQNQIHEAGKNLTSSQLQIEAMYYSPLLRTQQTAQVIQNRLGLPDDKLISHPLLAEAWVGVLEGDHDDPAVDELLNGHETEGEDYGDLSIRLFSFLSELCQNDYNQSVLLVTHETPSRVLQYLLTVLPTLPAAVEQSALLQRFVFTPKIRSLLFDSKFSLPKFKNGEVRHFDSEPFCNLYKRRF